MLLHTVTLLHSQDDEKVGGVQRAWVEKTLRFGEINIAYIGNREQQNDNTKQ